MNIRKARKIIEAAGYVEIRRSSDSHHYYEHPETGDHITLGPDYFKGHSRGPQWIRSLQRRLEKGGRGSHRG